MRDYDGARRAGHSALRARSSTRCSTRASTCRRARSRPGSSRAAHDDAALDRVADALPAAAGAAAARRRRDRRMSERTVVHLLRHGEVHNPQGVLYGRLPGYQLSELAGRWPSGSPSASPTATSPTRRLAARARPETAAPLAGEARPRRSRTDDRLIEAATSSRASRSVSATASLKPAGAGSTCEPVPALLGRALQGVAERMLAAVAAARDGRARPRGRAGLPPAADLDRPAARRATAGSGTTRAAPVPLAASPPSRTRGITWSRSASPSPRPT